MEDKAKLFEAFGLNAGKVKTMLKNETKSNRLAELLIMTGKETGPKHIGVLLEMISTTLPPKLKGTERYLVEKIVADDITKKDQLTAAFKFLAKLEDKTNINTEDFDKACGVGVVISPEEIQSAIDSLVEENKTEIEEKKWNFNFTAFIHKINDTMLWADRGIVVSKIRQAELEILGPKPKDWSKQQKTGKAKRDKAEKKDEGFKNDLFAPKDRLSKLISRDIAEGENTKKNWAKHTEFAKGRTITRFPPEPNGYLHIGHAKSIRFNFSIAEDHGGVTYLRFDDTNPEKEDIEYIEGIIENVEWLGAKPFKITYSSDYMQELYDLGVELIKRGKGYVCHQTKEEMREGREKLTDSPNRDRSVEENLKLFNDMRMGKFEEGVCCMRMKGDMKHNNPNMRDHVAWRIKYTAHPHIGSKWCIYPTYDFTHCIIDSLENITHSLCTLEFENRRESYYWLLDELDLFKPYVWEFSRLNVSGSVLSKRKIDTMIKENMLTGWDDPRVLTLKGLRRRGYTPASINNFIDSLGVARKGNETVTDVRVLEWHLRKDLEATAPRSFCVLDPVKLVIVNVEEGFSQVCKGELFPGIENGGTVDFTLTNTVYIDQSDFSEEPKEGFFGLQPGQEVCLKYGIFIKIVEIVKKEDGTVDFVKVEKVEFEGKVKRGIVHWVDANHSIDVDVKLFNPLFNVENPKDFKDDWLDHYNHNSLVSMSKAKWWDFHKDAKVNDRFQFQRLGYFMVSDETTPDKIVLFRSVTLSESKPKKNIYKKIKASKAK